MLRREPIPDPHGRLPRRPSERTMRAWLTSIAADYQAQTGRRVAISYAASSALAKQIDQGAPADLFVSADLEWMDDLQARHLIRPETRRSLVGNRIVLVAPADQARS